MCRWWIIENTNHEYIHEGGTFRWACMSQLHFAARPQQTFAAPADLFGDLRLEVRFFQPYEVQRNCMKFGRPARWKILSRVWRRGGNKAEGVVVCFKFRFIFCQVSVT